MRKAALILLIAITMLTLNAASIRALSRGDAVLTSNDVRFSFSHNPAFLSARDYSVNIPINARIYNISGLLENDLVKDISDLSSMDRERMISSLLDLLREFNGTMPLLGLDEDISFTVGGFGLDVSLKESVITSGGSVGTTLSAAVEGAVAAGFGFKYERDDYLISLGITPKLSYSIYTSPVGIDTAVGILLDNSLFDNGSLSIQLQGRPGPQGYRKQDNGERYRRKNRARKPTIETGCRTRLEWAMGHNLTGP